jgi:DNA helicase-2/ATP-dependent DNA helicase PcrA
MISNSEKEENQHLEEIKEKLQTALVQIDEHVNEYARELQENKEYLWEHKAGMDHAEKVSVRQSVYQTALTGEAAVAKKNRLRKLMASPYFGRIDFQEKGRESPFPVYIGIHSYFDEQENSNLIHDWRAPVSSMFYDFELGDAGFVAPNGEIKGEILLKRQYRIRDGKMEFMLESSVNIHDDILQKELSRASDDKMKNIVATIQRDQNAIIRNENSRVLIIQGVAGSGKTSIALHRIAFLLYRFKDSISAKDILILSPNKVFADYISNVLPELGEEKIPEMGMEELASAALEGKFKFQTFFEQVSCLLEKNEEPYKNRIQFKASFEFQSRLNEYLTYIENNYFVPTDLVVNRYPVPAWFIEERFRANHRIPLFKRFAAVARDIEENVRIYFKYEINAAERNAIRTAVKKMFKITNLRNLYKDFYAWLEKPEMLKAATRSVLEYSDVFPLIYLKLRLEGLKAYTHVKHLLVDEMQDYTPVQYAVLSRLFNCKKTILGDANQSVNPYSSSSSEVIQRVFPAANAVKLNTSYRSTFEITSFAQKISANRELEAIERHGEAPTVSCFERPEDELQAIKTIITGFSESEYNSFGIICKTQQQANELYEQLKESMVKIQLLTAHSTSFGDGIILTTAHLAKGLEFDQVVVPFVSAENYNNNIDKSMLYIACTRAMHKLSLTCLKGKSKFIPEETGQEQTGN